MGIGKRIKEARHNKGLTQEELAMMIGVTKGAIANYENETSHPKEPVMYALIDALGVEPNFLFQDCVHLPTREKNPDTAEAAPGEDHIIALYRKLNHEGQEKLIDYADDLVASGKYIKSDPDNLGKEA